MNSTGNGSGTHVTKAIRAVEQAKTKNDARGLLLFTDHQSKSCSTDIDCFCVSECMQSEYKTLHVARHKRTGLQ
jgi:hypothetical protein